MIGRRRLLVVWACLALVLPATADAGDLVVKDAWVSLPLIDDEPAPVYMRVENNGGKDRKLTRATSARADAVEIRLTEFQDGRERSKKVDDWVLPGGSVTFLQPGGVHLVLLGAADLAPGDEVTVELVFDGGEKISVEALVKDE